MVLQSSMIEKFEGDFPKLSKANSIAIGSRLFYIKKDNGSYIAWDYKTRYKIVATNTKDRLIDWLRANITLIEERISALDL